MSTRPPAAGRPAPGDGGGEYARAEALAGVAREVDGLRRTLEILDGMPGRVDDLARAVADLADTVTDALTTTNARPRPTPAPSWLTAPTDVDDVAGLLAGLVTWLGQVYLRYSDATGLPECWLWHPEVTEELLWLQWAWITAYQSPSATVALAGDWHDRQRPGVVRRVKTYAGSCSRERHQTRTGWNNSPQPAMTVPGVDACASITAWWATTRDQPAPEPPPEPGHDQRWDTHPGTRPGPNGTPQGMPFGRGNGNRPW